MAAGGRRSQRLREGHSIGGKAPRAPEVVQKFIIQAMSDFRYNAVRGSSTPRAIVDSSHLIF
jgi:hypothetical protein